MDFDLKEIKTSYLNDRNILGIDFYSRDTSLVARELIGKILCKKSRDITGNISSSGIILETEAYYGAGDAASHASRGKTPRSEIMFGRAGMSYVYFCYGMYYLLNAVTENVNIPGAVLIRAVWPLEGIEIMQKRRLAHRTKIKNKNIEPQHYLGNMVEEGRNKDSFAKSKRLTGGPGKLTVAFGIDISDNKKDLTDSMSDLNIYSCSIKNSGIKILSSPRIGISSAREMHLRYFVNSILVTGETMRFLQ